MSNKVIERLRNEIHGTVLLREPLSNHTTYCTGGYAEILVIPEDSKAFQATVITARQEGLPLTVLGAGSNVIAPDEGIRGITICNRRIGGGIEFPGENRVRVDSGVMLEDLIKASAQKGLGGFEGVMGIPGTVGGAIVMNAGTDEGTIYKYLKSVDVLDSDGERFSLGSSELSSGYRTSNFTDSGLLILDAEFILPPGDKEKIIGEMESVWEERRRKFPLDLPSAGSVFKRPEGDFAGRLIEEASCKGLTVGGAMVSDLHANFIVNTSNATSSDILTLISLVRARVLESSGVSLELEQIFLDAK